MLATVDDGGTTVDETSPTAQILQGAFAVPAHLRGLRPRVSGAAAWLGEDARERAVLAVHEASVVACGLIGGLVDGDEPPGSPCELYTHADAHGLVAEIRLPSGARHPTTAGEDPLRYVRAFSDETSWSGTPRTRRLRVVVHAG